MTTGKSSKINKLLRSWPRGTVAVQSWLSSQSISPDLAKYYTQSNWLKRIGKGAFIRADDTVDWTGGIFALQNYLNFEIHVAAATALDMHGHRHFISLDKIQTVWLFQALTEKRTIPEWMRQFFSNQVNIKVMKRNLFVCEQIGLVKKDFNSYQITISSPERAMMEYLDLVPLKASYDQGVYIMEGLMTLRPKLVQALLENCKSVKVKRLFMYLAEEENLPWIKRLDLSKVDFGAGKRVIGRGGKFNSKYNLSVPIIKEG